MSDAYSDKSTSLNKAQARAFGYSHLTSAEKSKHHIVIVGHTGRNPIFLCDDIPYLISIGVRPNKIIACGIVDPKRPYVKGWDNRTRKLYDSPAAWAKEKYGVIASPHNGIAETVAWAIENKKQLGSVNVDLCGTVRGTGPIVAAISAKVRQSCLILYTYIRIRDGFGINARQSASPDEKDILRTTVLRDVVGRSPDARLCYRSNTDTSSGSPMCVNVFKKQYLCSKCGQLGQHPSAHKKICSSH